MKLIYKIIIGIVAIIATIGTLVYMKNMPISLEVSTVTPKVAELYFNEQGFVKADDKTTLYSLASGSIISINVEKDQEVKKGDIICVIDSYPYDFKIKQLQSEIMGYNAQISNLSLEEKKAKDGLIYNKEQLQSEYQALIAQQDSLNVTKSEQERLQNILIEQSKKNLAIARDDFNVGKLLYDSGALSKKEYDVLDNKVSTAISELDTQQQQLELIKTGEGQNSAEYFDSMKTALQAQINSIDSAKSKSYTSAMSNYYNSLIISSNTSIQLINRQIEDCTIIAPTDGKITELFVENSNILSEQMPVAEISSKTGDEIEVYVSTKNIDMVKVGDTVDIILRRQQGDNIITGKISNIDSEATAMLSALGVEERKVLITIVYDNTSKELKPGYDVDVKFTTFKEDNALTVPKSAVFKDAETNKHMVFAVVNNKAELKEITIGVELRTEYILTGGLKSGDIVIKDASSDGLKTGVNVDFD